MVIKITVCISCISMVEFYMSIPKKYKLSKYYSCMCHFGSFWCVLDFLVKQNCDNIMLFVRKWQKLFLPYWYVLFTYFFNPSSSFQLRVVFIVWWSIYFVSSHVDQDFHSTQRNCAPEHKTTQKPPIPMKPSPKTRNAKSVVIASTSQQGMGEKRGRSQSATGQACTVPFTAVLGTIPSFQSSQDSSSSESTSLSDMTPQMKEYENADTLERRESIDQYSTARGDMQPPTSAASTPTNPKRTNPIITPFDPNERHKLKKASAKKSPAPKPRAESVPPELSPKQPTPGSTSMQNVHSDMYSTAFALQTLGDGGTWPKKYLNTVRTMWDDQLHQPANAGKSQGLAPGNQSAPGCQDNSSQEVQGHTKSDQGQYLDTCLHLSPPVCFPWIVSFQYLNRLC